MDIEEKTFVVNHDSPSKDDLFWKETNKDENLRFSVNNIYFKGPTDFHLSKEERKNRWSSVKDDKLKRGATKAIFN